MAVNFANEKLVKISCDKVCNDHHNVQNLITTDDRKRFDGFQVEYFIRPPVMIKIEMLKQNIDLMAIQLGLRLRDHQSKGIEIYVINPANAAMQLIARCYDTSEIFTIINSCYRLNQQLPAVNDFPPPPQSYTIANRNIRFCRNIKCIFIKILHTFNSSVPCLKFISIYGKPSGLRVHEMSNFFSSLNHIECISGDNQQRSSNIRPTERSHDLAQQIEHLAPPEFMDALTNDLMRIPYQLPSGKNIDKITLNKYMSTQNDSTAIDPFTRLPFTENRKPTLNLELKARIDLFFSTNGQSEIDRRKELRRNLFNLP